MGLGPVPAVAKLFDRTGLSFEDLELVELNEAFASQVLGVLQGWGWNDPDRLNVNGSGISLGHPIGATGARMMVTLLHELRRRGGGLGLETMCIGGGQGMAAVFEVPTSAADGDPHSRNLYARKARGMNHQGRYGDQLWRGERTSVLDVKCLACPVRRPARRS